jgi:molybdopterin/thiamine biosynthesis adenylyltransferase
VIRDEDRYTRQIALFGREGQQRIKQMHVGLVGLGGLGSHVAQQLAFLGIERYTLVDGDTASDHSLNRLVTAVPTDVGTHKTDLAKRLILAIKPTSSIADIPKHLNKIDDPHAALRNADLIVGSLDNDLARLQLTDIASALGTVYIDAATDIHTASGSLIYGGRILTSGLTPGCLHCLDLLDQQEMRRAGMTDAEKSAEAAIYGIPVDALNPGTGPSVVTINGVVASLAATEAMAHITGLRDPIKQLIYRGDEGGVRINRDEPGRVCPYCTRWATTRARLV